jgi:hypothetical protein
VGKSKMQKMQPLVLILFILLFINTGCIQSTKKNRHWQPIDRNTAPVVHEVQWKAETLSIIAKWYTGESKNWGILADANPNINPDSIAIGNKIFIPSDLVKTKDPLTKQFVTNCYRIGERMNSSSTYPKWGKKGGLERAASQSTTSDEDDFEVIGPK